LALVLTAMTVPSSSASPPVQGKAKVQAGTGRGGLAIRVTWLEREDASKPARLTKYVFPVACDYDSQEVRGVHPLGVGAELREDEDGNKTMVLPEPLAIAGESPLFVGSVSDVVLYSKASLQVKQKRPKRPKVPAEILERFTADDAILALADPELSALAGRLKSEAEGELDLVLRTWRHVYGLVSYGRVKRPNTAAQVLQWRKGQCGEYSKLTIALLRANGIPARGVWCVRAGNTGPAGNDHAWAEAWITGIGWFPIRPQEEVPEKAEFPLGYHSYQVVCRPRLGMDELRVVEWENVTCATGYRGVGYFADVPEGKRDEAIRLLEDVSADVEGRHSARLLKRAKKAHRAVQPCLYWLLAASPDDRSGPAAAELLVEICGQKDRRLSLERFVDASPRVVRDRIADASE